MEHPAVLDAVCQLEAMAEAGRHPQEVAAAAAEIAAGWWLGAAGDIDAGRLVVLCQDLRMWCTVTRDDYASRWDHQHRSGRPDLADEARRWAEAMDEAQRALRMYD
jgi:hypothetical protein